MTAPGSKTPNGDTSTGLLSLELTTRCNSPCRHCFARSGRGNDAELPLALAAAACQEGFAIGCRHLHLTGGEPLLWPALFRLLALAGRLGYRSIFLNSNGFLMTAATADRLAHYPGLSVSISLQGPKALNDAVRGAGSYRRAADGIRCALAARLPVSVFTVVGRALLARLPSFALQVKDDFDGIERLTLIQLLPVPGAPPDLEQDLLDPEAFTRMVRTVSALNLYGVRTHVLNNPLVNAAAELLPVTAVPRSRPLCRPGKVTIKATGHMTLAHSTSPNVGIYTPGRLAALPGSPCYQSALEPNVRTCSGCRFRRVCRRHDLQQPSPEAAALPAQIPFCQAVLAHCERAG